MKTIIIALLMGLLAISQAEDTDSGKQFSWDSDDEGTTESYDGIIVQVYKKENESPSITLSTEKDDRENVYCFNFLRTFEADYYDTTISTDTTYSEVSGSSVDLGSIDCAVSEDSSSSFSIQCTTLNGGTLSLIFQFTQNDDNDYGLEYTVNLEDYQWTDSSASLVLVQSLSECSAEYPHSVDSMEDNENGGIDQETDGDDDGEETDDPSTRRLSSADDDDESNEETEEPSDSLDEADGISSDDSDEFDAGFARFVVDGQAYDKCEGQEDKMIDSKLVYQSKQGDDGELHIVFAHFDCDLYLDPFIGIDDAKLKDEAVSIRIMWGVFMSLMVALLF